MKTLPPKQTDLPHVGAKNNRPLDAQKAFATAAQLASALPFADELHDKPDAFLRRLCDANNLNPRTRAPWLPKPVRGQYAINPAILGLLEYFYARARRTGADFLPRHCNSMDHAAQIFPMLSKAALQYARKHSPECASAIDEAGRLDTAPFQKFYGPLINKLVTGGAEQLEGFEELDLKTQQARREKEVADEKTMDNAERVKLLRTPDEIEDEIAGPLAVMQSGLDNFERRTGNRLRNKLLTYGLNDAQAAEIVALAVAGVNEPRAKLKEALTNAARLTAETAEKLKGKKNEMR